MNNLDRIFNLNLVKFIQPYFLCSNQSSKEINQKDYGFMSLDYLVKAYFYNYISR